MFTQDLGRIAQAALEKEEENHQFRLFLEHQESQWVDQKVQALNEEVAPQIDCRACGNCCRGLMINVDEEDTRRLATHLSMPVHEFESDYIEISPGGMRVFNTIPCHFLASSQCSVYEARPAECRTFPGLHLDRFISRSFASLMHFGRCPIIFNVVEQLKKELGFFRH